MPFLNNSFHCLDCDWIGENSRNCEKCLSLTVHPVSSWLAEQPSVPSEQALGDIYFSVPHGLKVAPKQIEIEMISEGRMWTQNPPFDATNLYLVASDLEVTAKLSVFVESGYGYTFNIRALFWF